VLTQHYAMLASGTCLYTGVTRGKRLVFLWDRGRPCIAVKNVSGRRRWSKLNDGFSAPFHPARQPARETAPWCTRLSAESSRQELAWRNCAAWTMLDRRASKLFACRRCHQSVPSLCLDFSPEEIGQSAVARNALILPTLHR